MQANTNYRPAISVIVPVYNVELFVKDAILSVKNQTFKNFECIIVDDGSTDDSKQVVADVIRGDNRFKIISQGNSGLSSARNTGIKVAKADLIYFLDSDDIISPTLIQEIVTVFHNAEIDCVCFGFQRVTQGFNLTGVKKAHIINQNIISAPEAIHLLLNGKIHQMAWSFAFKTDQQKKNNIWFSEGRLFEDNNFAAKLFAVSTKISRVNFDEAPYYYRSRNDAITAKANVSHTKRELVDELFIFKDVHDNVSSIVGKEDANWYFNKRVHLFNKYKASLGTTDDAMVANGAWIRSHRRGLKLSVRDKVRYLRTQISIFDTIIRKVYGE